MLTAVFERFTDRSRRVLVLAQEEARLLEHPSIGTEHILLGLVGEGEGLAARVLGEAGLTLEATRACVRATVGDRRSAPASSGLPFTPQAKKALELALRQALRLGDHEIRPEHLLLGLLDEEQAVAVEVLTKLGTTPDRLRRSITAHGDSMAEPQQPGPEAGVAFPSRPHPQPAQSASRAMPMPMPAPMPARGLVPGDRCALCERDLWEVPHYVAAGHVQVCDDCIRSAMNLIEVAPPERRRLSLPPRVFGTPPEDGAAAAIADVVMAAFDPMGDAARRSAAVTDTADLGPALDRAAERLPVAADGVRVSRIRFLGLDLAQVRFHLLLRDGREVVFEGPLRRHTLGWALTRQAVSEVFGWGGIDLPPVTGSSS